MIGSSLNVAEPWPRSDKFETDEFDDGNVIHLYPNLAKIECKIKFLRLNVSMLNDNNDVCVSGGFYYVINMFNLRSTAPLVEVPFNYTIRNLLLSKS